MSEEQKPQPEQKPETPPVQRLLPRKGRPRKANVPPPPQPERPFRPQLVNPTSEEEVDRMRKAIPSTDPGIFAAFDDQQSTIPGVVGGMLGLQNKDWLSIMERSNIPNEHQSTILDMIRIAEHGIGGEVLDIPIAYVGKQVVNYARTRISITNDKGHGQSREEVVEILTNWAAKLEAREADQKKKAAGVAG
jgi:hypothetical protein